MTFGTKTALVLATMAAGVSCDAVLQIEVYGVGSGDDGGVGSAEGGGGRDSGPAPTSPGCPTRGPGLDTCPGGTGTESCCTSLGVDGGTFYRTYVNPGSGPTNESDEASVSDFRLDKYLVTVGRFRQFFGAWNDAGYRPAASSGKHAYLNDGGGLANSADPGTFETGWLASDDDNLVLTDAVLGPECGSSPTPSPTWTPSAGANENLPINCVNWYEAYAFCIWDGGFLPSAAEWAYAAAGGNLELEYPWGSTDPGAQNKYAIYGDGLTPPDCYYPTNTLVPCTSAVNIAPVGTATSGAALWGQLDMAGEVWEWNLDWSVPSLTQPCNDCAYLTMPEVDGGEPPTRAFAGGTFSGNSSYLMLPPQRDRNETPLFRDYGTGFRCARAPAAQ
jgi:sulfatase modifying factor 1